eukprot:gnl/TRDRNA2_/TRDRNA2_29247_c0_seq2.p1 gnl/TRDRNA2_/TRDRNA2_29247_c0~~gnl/TRDRNA2_/TRDRNA2_29247_c0_seq2.p1  ORF type:complete len:205 (+),score=40.66 gnl/TRDRNA2_/TRDRNA2_29247_c0_seq2:99-713(+)
MTSAWKLSNRVLFFFIMAWFGLCVLLAVNAGMKWQHVIDVSKGDFEKKQCTVLNTTTEKISRGSTWRADYLPKVEVLVHGDPRGPDKPLWAYKYQEEHSSTRAGDYDGSDFTGEMWLQQFPVGKEVPCWQDKENPEVVMLTEEHSEKSMAVLCSIGAGICFLIASAGVAFDQRDKLCPGMSPQTRGLSREDEEDEDDEDQDDIS